MKKLKFHEKKLLKKVDFYNWECDNSLHENKVMRKYRILKREQYTMYNKLSRYGWIGRLLWFFNDNSFSRTNSNGTYRYEKQLSLLATNQLY